ncbi:MAG: Trk system potassium transporter TrkA [Halodesulfovibrio sp.]|uniref:Trk system potassium transporter TrkA n=1 Tax=Halodesulfovibrio sp. TaxID=1912772 RepID=UPI00359DEA3C
MRLFHREPKVDQLKVVVVGAGEVGYHISHRLAQEHKQVVVIDQDESALRRISEVLDVQTILGSGSSPEVLKNAGAEDADIFLAVTDSDEVNIIACLFANIIAPNAKKLARIRNEEYGEYSKELSENLLNISAIINPEVEVIKSIDRLLSMPGAVDYNEFAGGKIKLIGVRMGHGPLLDQALVNFRSVVPDINVIIAAIVRDDALIIPGGSDTLQKDDIVYFVCKDTSIESVRKACGRSLDPIKNAFIIGGGNIGFRLASLFEQKGIHTKIVDSNPARCSVLAEKLDAPLVLCGDGTDQEFLQEENIAEMDVVISLTSDEETNILTSLLAKNLGVKKTVTRVNKLAYQPLIKAVGIDHSVSPRLSAVNSILQYVRQGKVLSSVSISGEGAEALEAIAENNSEIVGKPIKDLPFPKGTLVIGILRDTEVIIPSGDSVIHPDDRIIILTTPENVARVEQALLVTLQSV